MALGGGTWQTQNKTLPGSYINFVSASSASAALSDRGIATMPLMLDWGPENEVFSVTNAEFQKDSLKIFGYLYTSDELRSLRDLFQGIKTGYFYRLNGGGKKAVNAYATARYTGTRGNALRIVIEANENSTDGAPLYDVSTLVDTAVVDIQKGVSSMSNLHQNDYVVFDSAATIALTAGTPLSGGENGSVVNEAYQTYLDKIESYRFHVIGCPSNNDAIKQLFVGYTKRMRDECGVKFQCVLFRQSADYEGVISVENGLADDKENPAMVYWVTGAEAGCAVNKDLTNSVYTGEHLPDLDYKQMQLEAGIRAGKLMFHRVGDETRVLEDINTFTSVKDEKSSDFSSNQTIRVLDQIGNDIAAIFNDKYNGKVPNDNAGRISFWNDVVRHHQALQNLRAIDDFSSDNVEVTPGDTKKSVLVSDTVKPVSAMKQLYMTVVVN